MSNTKKPTPKKERLNIDGENINIEHFAKMPKEEAIERMLADGFCKGENDDQKREWAGKAWDLLKAEFDRPEDEEPKGEAPKRRR